MLPECKRGPLVPVMGSPLGGLRVTLMLIVPVKTGHATRS